MQMICDESEYDHFTEIVSKSVLMPINVCDVCKHYRGEISKNGGRRVCCDAFPDGIPRYIFNLGYDHREPYPNDNGIRFKMKPDLSESDMERVKDYEKSVFSKESNEEILKIRELFMENNGEGEPEYDVYDDYEYDDDDDDDLSGIDEELAARIEETIRGLVKEYSDYESMTPRYDRGIEE